MIIQLDAPEQSDLDFRRFDFPDGQPHYVFEPDRFRQMETGESIEIIGAIRSGNDLVNMLVAVDAVYSAVSILTSPPPLALNVSYLLGARMDRRIGPGQPFSLDVVAGMLQSGIAGRAELRILDPHSKVTLTLLPGAKILQPDALIKMVLLRIEQAEAQQPVVVIPDAGAIDRTLGILERLNAAHSVAYCTKVRDEKTGKLSGFALNKGEVNGRVVVIVDDICDGGGTFSGIADVLRNQGATKVHLCVTHGVFSKGIEIRGIDEIFSSDSYKAPSAEGYIIERDPHVESVSLYKKAGKTRLTLMTHFVAQILTEHTTIGAL